MVTDAAWMSCPFCSMLPGDSWTPTAGSIARLCGGHGCWTPEMGVRAMEHDDHDRVARVWPKDRLGGLKAKCPGCAEYGTIHAIYTVSGSVISYKGVTDSDKEPDPDDCDTCELDYELDSYRCTECNRRFRYSDIDDFFPTSDLRAATSQI